MQELSFQEIDMVGGASADGAKVVMAAAATGAAAGAVAGGPVGAAVGAAVAAVHALVVWNALVD